MRSGFTKAEDCLPEYHQFLRSRLFHVGGKRFGRDLTWCSPVPPGARCSLGSSVASVRARRIEIAARELICSQLSCRHCGERGLILHAPEALNEALSSPNEEKDHK